MAVQGASVVCVAKLSERLAYASQSTKFEPARPPEFVSPAASLGCARKAGYDSHIADDRRQTGETVIFSADQMFPVFLYDLLVDLTASHTCARTHARILRARACAPGWPGALCKVPPPGGGLYLPFAPLSLEPPT
eukprot:gene18902-biopygen9987